MEIRLEHDLVLCRQRARQLTAALGFSPQAQIRVATALSEIARNAYQYAGGGRVEFLFEREPRTAQPPRQSLVIAVHDSGPGIAALAEILAGRYRSATGLGLGILGARRLMTALEVETSAAGSTVTMREVLPASSPSIAPAQLQQIVDTLRTQAPASALEEMLLQNQELLRAIDEARQREDEIQRINHELAETNSGVLALYDELETLHRVSVLLAAQLELKTLIQSIIDVTTELTSAELGAFFFSGEGADCWMLYASAGRAREVLTVFERPQSADFFGPDFGREDLLRLPDLLEHGSPCSVSKFAALLAPHFQVRACLVVPVVAEPGHVFGAMVFAAAEPDRFTERSERIVASIATQAVVGIEKSQLYQDMKASSEAKDRFLAMLSHELRTPLNPVLATVTSWLSDDRIHPELRAEVTMVVRNVRLEARLIDDLLDFNKLINGKLSFDHSLVDLHGVVHSVVEICRADVDEARLDLKVDLTALRTGVLGDAARLQQVLWNVMKNAIKFTPHGGRITVRTSNPREDSIRLEVIDSGHGIEAESLERIFGAFEQGQPQILARFGGLGLGLAISKTFVERHGGTIRAHSAGLGLGAQMIVELPLSETPIFAPQPSADTAADLPLREHGRILLVDDHEDTLATLGRLLTRRGHQVTPVGTAAAARQAFTEGAFDIIISDLGLPDATGLELLAQLRGVRFTPAIALSGYGMDADLISSKSAGFQEHLTKPIDFERLLRAIQQVLNPE